MQFDLNDPADEALMVLLLQSIVLVLTEINQALAEGAAESHPTEQGPGATVLPFPR